MGKTSRWAKVHVTKEVLPKRTKAHNRKISLALRAHHAAKKLKKTRKAKR